jgi:hypothetical protein
VSARATAEAQAQQLRDQAKALRQRDSAEAVRQVADSVLRDSLQRANAKLQGQRVEVSKAVFSATTELRNELNADQQQRLDQITTGFKTVIAIMDEQLRNAATLRTADSLDILHLTQSRDDWRTLQEDTQKQVDKLTKQIGGNKALRVVEKVVGGGLLVVAAFHK